MPRSFYVNPNYNGKRRHTNFGERLVGTYRKEWNGYILSINDVDIYTFEKFSRLQMWIQKWEIKASEVRLPRRRNYARPLDKDEYVQRKRAAAIAED